MAHGSHGSHRKEHNRERVLLSSAAEEGLTPKDIELLARWASLRGYEPAYVTEKELQEVAAIVSTTPTQQ